MKNNKGDLRIWWISNPPRRDAFKRKVTNEKEAIKFLDLLGDYDLWLGDLIDTNACGLEVWENGEWSEYYNEDGQDIAEITQELKESKE